jgi:hypothetical protein
MMVVASAVDLVHKIYRSTDMSGIKFPKPCRRVELNYISRKSADGYILFA